MSDAINEDVAFKKKLYRKKLFYWKKCYTIHGKKNRFSRDGLF